MNNSMKKYIHTLLAATALAMAACSNDPQEPEAGTLPDDTSPVTIKANAGSRAETRVSYQEDPDGSQTHILWSAQEQFALCYSGAPTDANYLFVKDGAEADVSSANFIYTGAGLDTPPAGTLYAVYPGTEAIMAGDTEVRVIFSPQTNNDRHFMTATLQGSDLEGNWNNAHFTFQSRVALLKLTLTHADFAGHSPTSVSLQASGLSYVAKFNLANNEWTPDISITGITITPSEAADASGRLTIYIAQPPLARPISDITITATASGYTYSGTLPSGTFEGCYVYTAPEVAMVNDIQIANTMQFAVKPTGTQTEFALPFLAATGDYTLRVDWGDGSPATIIPSGTPADSDLLKHQYINTGQAYTITLATTAPDTEAQMPRWYFNNNTYAKMLVSMDSPMLNTNHFSFYNCFRGCYNLTTIPEDLFAAHTAITDFASCFRGCSRLTTIPAGIFANHTAAKHFRICFEGCTRLATIPEELFATNTAATDFSYCFFNCNSVVLNPHIFCKETDENKAKRFLGRTIDFASCFYNAGSALEAGQAGTAPALWTYEYGTGVIDKDQCYNGCTNITNYGLIPEEWR